jgi:hypothetical protein
MYHGPNPILSFIPAPETDSGGGFAGSCGYCPVDLGQGPSIPLLVVVVRQLWRIQEARVSINCGE